MNKLLAMLTVGILALEAVIVITILSSGSQFATNFVSETADYDNPASRQALLANIPDKLTIITNDKSQDIEKDTLVSWRDKSDEVRHPNPDSSLANYFFSRTGTSHPWAAYSFDDAVEGVAINDKKIQDFLQKVATEENHDPVDAELVVENGRASVFTPDEPGTKLDIDASQRALLDALLSDSLAAKTVQLPVTTTSPRVRLSDINTLGIRERLVRGASDFHGSTASRIKNIRVGAERYRGLIIAPGEEFSFNKNLGPVDGAHGFVPELVIKPEGTVPEFGGGLCQVSTTAFRAAFFGGLPITARRNHAYAVKYYEWISDKEPPAPGLDATIYPGASDLKFINDTPAAILVWTKLEGTRLYFDFYGTSDGRQVEVDGPHPFDRKASGAVKSTVTRKVTRAGEVVELTLKSNYVSPNLYPRVYEFPKPAVEPPPPDTGTNPDTQTPDTNPNQPTL